MREGGREGKGVVLLVRRARIDVEPWKRSIALNTVDAVTFFEIIFLFFGELSRSDQPARRGMRMRSPERRERNGKRL